MKFDYFSALIMVDIAGTAGQALEMFYDSTELRQCKIPVSGYVYAVSR